MYYEKLVAKMKKKKKKKERKKKKKVFYVAKLKLLTGDVLKKESYQ